MVTLEPHPHGVVLRVIAHPGAKRAAVGGQHDGRLKVSVNQPPEKGKANQSIIALLAKALGVSKSRIALLSGESARHKSFLVTGIGEQEAAAMQAVVAGLADPACAISDVPAEPRKDTTGGPPPNRLRS